MKDLWPVYVGLGLLAAAYLVGALQRRVDRVSRYRRQLLLAMERAVVLDRLGGLNDITWRYRAFDAVSDHQMVWQFWRELESFYEDLRFTEPSR